MDLGAVALEDLQRNGTAPPARVDLHGVLSVASGGSDGWRVLANHGGDAVLGKVVKIEKGFLVGAKARSGKAKLISALQVPAALVAVLKQRARPALESASLLARLTELHGAEAAEDAIQVAVRKLDEEGGTRCVALNGIIGRDAKVRYTRLEDGRMVFAAIDLAQAAKGCGYKTAQKTVWDIAKSYYDVDLDDSLEVEGNSLHFQRIIFGGQGSRPTLCVTIEKAVELVALLPGSEVAAALRRQCAEAFVRVAGGDLSLIDDVVANRKLQDYLDAHDPENPIREAGKFAERGRKRSFDEMHGEVQSLARHVGEVLNKQSALEKIAANQELALKEIAGAIHKSHTTIVTEVLAAIKSYAGQATLPLVLAIGRLEARVIAGVKDAILAQTTSVCARLQGVVEASVASPSGAFVKALRACVRAPSKRASDSEALFPSGQKRGDDERSVGAWLQLTSLVDRELRAEQLRRGLPAQPLCYSAWKAERSRLGRALKRDRLRRRGLDEAHPDFCRRPLLWDRMAGGAAYVMHASEERHVLRVLRHGARSALDAVLRRNAGEYAKGEHARQPWPLNCDDLLYGYVPEELAPKEGAAESDVETAAEGDVEAAPKEEDAPED
jgi:hypothetical protein